MASISTKSRLNTEQAAMQVAASSVSASFCIARQSFVMQYAGLLHKQKCILVSQQSVTMRWRFQIWCHLVSQSDILLCCHNQVSQSDVLLCCHNQVSQSDILLCCHNLTSYSVVTI